MEDEQGEPFVGRSGEMLDGLLTLAGLDRSQVYITNVLRCRPPNNKFPTDPAPHLCAGYLRKEIEFIQPLVVVLLGAKALTHLLLPNTGVMVDIYAAFVGKWYRRRDRWAELRFVTVYHPSYLLRNKSPQDEELSIATLTAVAHYVRARQANTPPPAIPITEIATQPSHMIQPRNLFRGRAQ
jgi:DNA polymerase